ncbi:MAG: LCP family protein [Clostridia bacterium]|jgi:LCP family protein required for cell wall assembly
MIFKKFLTVFATAMFTVLILTGFIAVIIINAKQEQVDASTDNGTNGNTNISDDEIDWTDRYVDAQAQPFNVLLFVSDVKGADTDAIILINIDSVNSKISSMSIPRDTIIKNQQKALSIYESSTNTILEDEKVIDIFEEFLSTDIKYTVRMNVNVIADIVNALGGLDFYIPADITYYDNGVDAATGVYDPDLELVIEFKKGQQYLSGSDVVKLLRFRKATEGTSSSELEEYYGEGSDLNRIEMDKQIINAFLEQVFEMSRRNLISKLTNLLSLMYDDIDFYITLSDAQNILNTVLEMIPTDSSDKFVWSGIEWYTLPGSYVSSVLGDHYEIDAPATATIIKNSFNILLD